MEQDPFKEYIKETEPEKRDKGYAWHTAIGLQAVDGLRPSKYLIDTAIKNIEGDISMDEAGELLNSYYKENPKSDETYRTEEADKVSLRIAKILSEKAFSFTPNEYISIHRKLFTGIYSHAGRIRDYNITKKEWVLNGATVLYGSASELRATLEYDFSEEKKFSYKNLNMDQIIHHLAVFVSKLWQIHIFAEGNTRTTAVFFIKYLRTLGFDDANDIFAEHAWYFRNALVRANYTDLKNGVHETTEYLELFLKNLLLDEKNELHNRTMHVSGKFNNSQKADIEEENIVSCNVWEANAMMNEGGYKVRKVPENNSYKKEIEEIVKLCEKAIPEYGEKASFFNAGASEEEMKQWEENNQIRIPESYKEWLRFSADCQIRQNLAGFYFPRFSEIVPSDLVIIGWLIGDGELLCFSKENGNFIRWFEGEVNDEFENFGDMLKEIIRMLKEKSEISKEATDLFMKFMKNAEEREKHSEE